MNGYPESLENLIAYFKMLPGIGRRNAERLAFAVLKWDAEKLSEFSTLLKHIKQRIGTCPECFTISENNSLCEICGSVHRDKQLICVVEDFAQLQSIEDGNFYHGVYHCLGGKISPLDDVYGENLRVKELLGKIEKNEVKEVIIALGSDVESKATAIYLSDLLKKYPVKISQLSQGLPVGANLTYADSATLSIAMKNRVEVVR